MASELKVNKITPESGVTLTLGDSGDTINFGSGVLPNFENLTVTGDLTVDTNSLKVDSTNNFVGIGTASPTVALDVVGAITATGNITGTLATAAQPNITSLGTLTSATISGDLTIGTNHTIGDDANLNLELTSATNEDIVLASARNVQADLDHNSAGGTRTFAVTSQGLSKYHLLVNTGGDISFYEDTGTTAKFFWDASAERLGIGTTNPIYDLDITSDNPVLRITDSDSGTRRASLSLETAGGPWVMEATNDLSIRYSNPATSATSGSFITLGRITSPLIFGTNATEAMRIDSSGNVGIGTSSPSFALSVSSTSANTITAINNASNISRFCFAENSTPSNTFTNIEGDARSSGYIAFRTNDTQKVKIDQNGSIPIFSTQSNISARNSNGAGTTEAFFTGLYSAPNNSGGGTVSLRLWTNGNIQNTNNSYTALSDIKLKENIVDANSQWEDIKALKVRNYNFKEGQTHTQIGLIAQELESTSPNLVFDVVDKDDDGNDLGTVTKSVNYSVLYMKAVKALQEALTEIDNLKARVDTLEGN